MNPTNFVNPNANYFSSGATFDTSKPISTSTLTSNEKPMNVQTPEQTPYTTNATDSLDTSYQDILKGIYSTTPQETKVNESQGTIKALMSRITGKGGSVGADGKVDTSIAERIANEDILKQFGYTGRADALKQFQDVSSRLSALTKESLAIPLRLQEEAKGLGMTKGAISTMETGELRKNAIERLGVASLAEAIQGNLTTSSALAKDAVEMEFAPIQAELNALKFDYEMNKDALERADKKKADALNFMIQERERGLENEKADKTYTRNLALEAVKMGASQDVADKIANSTPDEAIGIGAKFFGEEFARQAKQQAFDNGIKSRQIDLQEAEFKLQTRKSLLELATLGDKDAIAKLGYDPNNLPLTTKEIGALEDQIGTVDRDFNTISRLLTNTIGLEKSAGLLRGQGVIAGVVGAVTEGGLGIGTLPYNLSKRNDFLADAKSIVTNETFTKFRELADQGVKLTPVSNAEIKLIGDSSGVLASSARYDDAGNLTGFAMSEDKVREELRKIGQSMQKLKLDLQGQLYLSDEDRDEIANIK